MIEFPHFSRHFKKRLMERVGISLTQNEADELCKSIFHDVKSNTPNSLKGTLVYDVIVHRKERDEKFKLIVGFPELTLITCYSGNKKRMNVSRIRKNYKKYGSPHKIKTKKE